MPITYHRFLQESSGGHQGGTTGPNDLLQVQFVAVPLQPAAPHQASPETIAAATQITQGSHHLRQHRLYHKIHTDPQQPPKSPIFDGTEPWQGLDLTGGGADVISYNQTF